MNKKAYTQSYLKGLQLAKRAGLGNILKTISKTKPVRAITRKIPGTTTNILSKLRIG